MTHIPVRRIRPGDYVGQDKLYRSNEIVHYFPEDVGKPFEVSTVVKHAAHPETTVGFISAIEDDPLHDAIEALKKVTQKIQKDANIAPLSEETEKFFSQREKVYRVSWSSGPPELSDFSKFVMPVVRRVNYSQIAQQAFQVQPMTAPRGGIFYMDYKYGEDVEKVEGDFTIGENTCEGNSQSTSGTAIEKSWWGSAIRTFFTRASTGVAQFARKIAEFAVEFIRFSK